MLTALSLGCVAGAPVDLDDAVELEPAGGHGTVGGNGEDWDDYAVAEVPLIAAALGGPLVQKGTLNVSSAIQNGLLATPEGQAIFPYLVRCAVPSGSTIVWNQGSEEGVGHMETAKDWLTRALTTAEVEDLLSCMVAYLNPGGFSVDVLFSGPHASEGEEHPELEIDEALWTARLRPEGGAEYLVYPLRTVKEECGVNLAQALYLRLCGSSPIACDFDMGDAADCNEVEGGFECAGRPALMTSLTATGFNAMWSSCN